jgi:hypothetical protein
MGAREKMSETRVQYDAATYSRKWVDLTGAANPLEAACIQVQKGDLGSTEAALPDPHYHGNLARALHQVFGMAIISGYPSELYDEVYSDWWRVSRRVVNDRSTATTECLWISPAADAAQAPLL